MIGLNKVFYSINSQGTNPQDTMRSPLMLIESFLSCLTNADKDGRTLITKQNISSQSSLKFLLLNPAVHFADVLRQARSVIVAGGTMQPVNEFKDQLFYSTGVTPDRIVEYSCGHVIPADNLVVMAVGSGPSGRPLDFTYQKRDNPKLLDELGMVLNNVCHVIPGGVVCFFPSYDYQKLVITHLETTGALATLSRKKKVFQEPRSSGQVDSILSQYTQIIQTCKNSSSLMTGKY